MNFKYIVNHLKLFTALNSNLAALTANVNPKNATKVDGGYIYTSLAPGAWTAITITLNNKLSSISYTQITPYIEGSYRIYAPIVTAYTANSVTIKVYSQETSAVNMGGLVLAYGK